jgi:hypothetical protein
MIDAFTLDGLAWVLNTRKLIFYSIMNEILRTGYAK